MSSPQLVSIIDDDESVRQSLAGLLRSLRYAVAQYASAEEFLAQAELGATSCLIVDVSMPGMNGVELHEKLISEGKRVPIVFISAHPDQRVRDIVLARGASAYLVKPFDEETLLDAVNRAFHAAQGNET